MARARVDADVFEGTVIVDVAYDRPIRLLPNGLAGIVYRDAVYPLYAGDVIHLEDRPLEKELCRQFLAWGAPTPYWPASNAGEEEHDDGELGIGSWYLESSRLGHYLAFDASEAAAEQLANAIEESGLGVVKLGESFRPADNGQRYDWYIRLRFRGSSDKCLSVIEDILSGGLASDHEDLTGPDRETQSSQPEVPSIYSIIARLVAQIPDPVERSDAGRKLREIGEDWPYLSWRFAEFSTRSGQSIDSSRLGAAKILSAIVREDQELISRIEDAHGSVFKGGPDSRRLAQRAIDLEFERIDLEDSWNTGDGALRRTRASMRFLRMAVVLTLASEDYSDRLVPMLNEIKPPAVAQFNSALPPSVTIAVASLRRVATLVEEFFAGDETGIGELYTVGHAEIETLHNGELDFIADFTASPPLIIEPQPTNGNLPFVILPPGERIQSIVGDLRKSARYRDREVDFGRVKVLMDLSEMIGPEHCSVYSGIFPSSGRDNGYMVLVIAFEDYGEDAVAISPWKNEHATYVVRPFDHPWQYVLSRTKDEAIELGARRLHFRPNPEHGMDQYEAMREKILALLGGDPDEFDTGGLHFDPDLDRYVLREGERRRPSAPKPMKDKPRSNDSPGFFQRIKDWF